MEIRAMLDRLATYAGELDAARPLVPDEAWPEVYGNPVGDPSVEGAVLRAAPFIARAAQVQVLREMAEYWQRCADTQDYEPHYEVWLEVARDLRRRANELEGRQ